MATEDSSRHDPQPAMDPDPEAEGSARPDTDTETETGTETEPDAIPLGAASPNAERPMELAPEHVSEAAEPEPGEAEGPEPGPEAAAAEGELEPGEAGRPVPGEAGEPEPGPEAAAPEGEPHDRAAEAYRARWEDIQAAFVDDPRGAAEDADQLAVELIDELVATLSRQREEIAAAWRHDPDASTEELRQAIQRYRAFVDQLVSA